MIAFNLHLTLKCLHTDNNIGKAKAKTGGRINSDRDGTIYSIKCRFPEEIPKTIKKRRKKNILNL